MVTLRSRSRRQRIRLAVLLISLLLFPVTMNYLSPYVIIDAASQGITNGSLVAFGLLFLSSLLLGRLWRAWVCPGAGLQRVCFGVNDGPARGGRFDWIKWAIWIVWIGVIALLATPAGGYRTVNVLHLTDSGISVDEPSGPIKYYFVAGLILAFTAGRRALCHYGCWMAPFMASTRMIPEKGAIGKVREIYDEIKSQLGIDFVPNLYRVMASKPGYIEANWSKVKAVMVEEGKLDLLTKEIIAVAVSAVKACDY